MIDLRITWKMLLVFLSSFGFSGLSLRSSFPATGLPRFAGPCSVASAVGSSFFTVSFKGMLRARDRNGQRAGKMQFSVMSQQLRSVSTCFGTDFASQNFGSRWFPRLTCLMYSAEAPVICISEMYPCPCLRGKGSFADGTLVVAYCSGNWMLCFVC